MRRADQGKRVAISFRFKRCLERSRQRFPISPFEGDGGFELKVAAGRVLALDLFGDFLGFSQAAKSEELPTVVTEIVDIPIPQRGMRFYEANEIIPVASIDGGLSGQREMPRVPGFC